MPGRHLLPSSSPAPRAAAGSSAAHASALVETQTRKSNYTNNLLVIVRRRSGLDSGGLAREVNRIGQVRLSIFQVEGVT